MHISSRIPLQALGGLVGVAIAGVLYIAVTEWSYLQASVVTTQETSSSSSVMTENEKQRERIAVRTQEILAGTELARHVPAISSSSSSSRITLLPGAPLKQREPVMQKAPDAPLPESGPALLTVSLLAGAASVMKRKTKKG